MNLARSLCPLLGKEFAADETLRAGFEAIERWLVSPGVDPESVGRAYDHLDSLMEAAYGTWIGAEGFPLEELVRVLILPVSLIEDDYGPEETKNQLAASVESCRAFAGADVVRAAAVEFAHWCLQHDLT